MILTYCKDHQNYIFIVNRTELRIVIFVSDNLLLLTNFTNLIYFTFQTCHAPKAVTYTKS